METAVLKFIQSQKLMVIASHNAQEAWVANIYIGVDDKGTIYFVSPEDTKHSQMILGNPKVAFSIAWFDPTNHANRKAIQGLGICHLAKDEKEIATGVQLHNKNFPEFKNRITIDWIHNNEYNSRIWTLTPTFIKYWDDEIYGDKQSKEFTLAK
jgi:uncharacterized protein YhbP (UPF0306 family)